MELWTAFIIGLAGSLHCVGMCGPIAIALPIPETSRFKFFLGRISYNLGRVITYAFLGIIFGFIGKSLFIGGYQKILSIALGVLILIIFFLPGKYTVYLTGARLHEKISLKLKGLWRILMQKKSIGSLFIIGILNGFLPCGLVYIAIAGSISTGTALGGALYMALFGIGTIPIMLAMSLVGKMFGNNIRLHLRKLLPVGAILLAALFILRGLSLGIPYISPSVEKQANEETVVKCCNHGDSTSNESIVTE